MYNEFDKLNNYSISGLRWVTKDTHKETSKTR